MASGILFIFLDRSLLPSFIIRIRDVHNTRLSLPKSIINGVYLSTQEVQINHSLTFSANIFLFLHLQN